MREGGFLEGCLRRTPARGLIDYVRRILDRLRRTAASIGRARLATGLWAGGGMCFELALEAPISSWRRSRPVAGLPFQPAGLWLHACHPKPGHERVSIAMLAATNDASSRTRRRLTRYPNAAYPGMEETRDAGSRR